MPSFTNPGITDDHGDPFVPRHGGEYLLYHTTDDGDRGISVHRSRDLVHWSFAGIALEPGPHPPRTPAALAPAPAATRSRRVMPRRPMAAFHP